MQKHYTGKQKAQIVLEMLKEEKTVTQISSEYGVHSSQLYKWRAQALKGLHTFAGRLLYPYPLFQWIC